MTWNRRNRFATVLFALATLLFMHFAVAAYSCPGGLAMGVKAAESTMTTQVDMPCAESMAFIMDDEQPSLCHAHCHMSFQINGRWRHLKPVLLQAAGRELRAESI